MAEDTFTKVIEVEKEIKNIVSDERRRVDYWLQGIKKELGSEYRRELKRLKEEILLTRRLQSEELEKEIAQTLEQARATARKYETVDERELLDLLREILQGLLPGRSP